MGYIDIHSHILANIDDGAKSIEESLALLEQEKLNGVTSVICTPHFYPEADTLESHLEKCNSAFLELQNEIRYKELPKIYLGHEVQYFTGISKCQTLDKLCIAGTNILLLELPFLSPLSSFMIKEVEGIDLDLGITVILAHVERYHKDRHFKRLIKLFEHSGIKAQINADSVFNPATKKVVQKLLKKGLVSYIASDTHSPKERPVSIGKAMKELKPKFYAEILKCRKNSEKLEEIIEGAANGQLQNPYSPL